MRTSNENYYNPFFSHIYIEKTVLTHPRTTRILDCFPAAKYIEIDHYKDVFCRSRQNPVLQHRAQKLILAGKQDRFLYAGAPVCQRFGQDRFYYCSCVMNCVYDCEYCYLKGMYPSGNIVIFVNLEDYFSAVEEGLKQNPMYLCVSYDTDLMALEGIAGYVRDWVDFAASHPRLVVEIRTKSAGAGLFEQLTPLPNVIYAFTLSPQAVIDAYEHQTPSLAQRLACVAKAQKNGFPVRLCFDPMVVCADWEKQYDSLLAQVFEAVDMARITDVSVGTFRVPQPYLKNMRRNEPDSAVVQYPYINDHGVYHYAPDLEAGMEGAFLSRLRTKLPAGKIFLWDPSADGNGVEAKGKEINI